MVRISLLTTLLALGVACASAETDYAGKDDAPAALDTDYDGNHESEDTGFGAGDADDEGPGPSEREDAFPTLMPAMTDIFVFIANPDRNTVTRVNVETLEVDTTTVGSRPRVVAISPDFTKAAVFNAGDDTVSLLDAETLEQTVVPVRDNLNNMVVSPDGEWVALWHDRDAVLPDDPTPRGVVSFNEVSLVNLHTGEHVPHVVGFGPKQIQFTPDGALALVVSDTTLASIALADDPTDISFVSIAEDPLDAPIAEEVVIEPNGRYAYVRQLGAEEIVVVNLRNGGVDRLPAGDNPTDLDLTPDGNKAVVIARGSRQLVVFDAHQPFERPEFFTLPGDDPLGSVTIDPTGRTGIIYTTAMLVDRYATWDIDTNDLVLRPLPKPIDAVTITPTGESMMIFHTEEDAPDSDPDNVIPDQPSVTLVDLSDFARSNTLWLPKKPSGYANANNGRFGYFVMDDLPLLEVIDYRTLLPTEIELRSDPVFVGVLPDINRTDDDEPPAWVSQEHPLGRITFFDPDDDEIQTITGFELNSQIED